MFNLVHLHVSTLTISWDCENRRGDTNYKYGYWYPYTQLLLCCFLFALHGSYILHVDKNYLEKRTIKIATQQIKLVKLPCALLHVFPGIALQTTDWELETHDEHTHARSNILAPSIYKY